MSLSWETRDDDVEEYEYVIAETLRFAATPGNFTARLQFSIYDFGRVCDFGAARGHMHVKLVDTEHVEAVAFNMDAALF